MQDEIERLTRDRDEWRTANLSIVRKCVDVERECFALREKLANLEKERKMRWTGSYQQTADRMEPGVYPEAEAKSLASLAISMKRIADVLERIEKAVEEETDGHSSDTQRPAQRGLSTRHGGGQVPASGQGEEAEEGEARTSDRWPEGQRQGSN